MSLLAFAMVQAQARFQHCEGRSCADVSAWYLSAAPAERSACVLVRSGILRQRLVVTCLNLMQLTSEDALSGLVMPAAADVILGKAGSVLVIAIAFMAVTSSGASEMVGAALLGPSLSHLGSCSHLRCRLTQPLLKPLHARCVAHVRG